MNWSVSPSPCSECSSRQRSGKGEPSQSGAGSGGDAIVVAQPPPLEFVPAPLEAAHPQPGHRAVQVRDGEIGLDPQGGLHRRQPRLEDRP